MEKLLNDIILGENSQIIINNTNYIFKSISQKNEKLKIVSAKKEGLVVEKDSQPKNEENFLSPQKEEKEFDSYISNEISQQKSQEKSSIVEDYSS